MTTNANNDGTKLSVVMFPWLGHGHISPFVELAKRLSNTNLFKIHLCSTRANLDSIEKMLKNERFSPSIQVVELHLPELADLPSHLHTTNGLPLHLMPKLKQAFDMASPKFSEILKTLKPDLLIYDIIQPWAPLAAAELGIPSVVFITTSVAAANRTYEPIECSAYIRKEIDRVIQCYENSTSIILVKSFKEMEGKNADFFSVLTGKKVVHVGPLVADPVCLDTKQNSVIEWLDTKATRSTVFVSFGSEYFLSNDDMGEIAYGLEMSNVNFIWVLRFPNDENKVKISQALPSGFLERVKNRGLLVNGWAPQTKILGHKNIAGFVSHCGWSSVMEAMKFGVPLIAVPMHLDQPVNARVAVEIGVGVEVVKDKNGRFSRENIASSVQHVVTSELGEAIREKASKMSVDLRAKGDEEIHVVVKELLHLYKTTKIEVSAIDGSKLLEQEKEEDEKAERKTSSSSTK